VESFKAGRKLYRFAPSYPMSAVETFWTRVKDQPLSRVGPGLITGVADDDPSGIATYSQATSQHVVSFAPDCGLISGHPVRSAQRSTLLSGHRKNPEGSGVQIFSRARPRRPIHAALTSIFFAGFWASAFLGFTVSTPFLKVASILSASTLSGSSKLRWNEPNLRSCR
jgi:hypothetical protein